MNAPRYTLPAIALHWAQAILIAWLLWLGWTMTDLPKGAERSAAYGLHKSLGLLALLLVILRLAWRQRHPAPPLPASGWEVALAKATHVGLYLFLLVAPLAGYLASSFTPFALKFFGIELPKVGWPDETLNGLFKQIHWLAVWSGAGLIALHVAGALKHALLGDGLLSRMLPGRLLHK
ncbi:MAG: cytochrome B [Betaproteobacteria bacterium HGW-Betaproteobacteria-7]|jgi:cytochrome b561|nr:MAG: cytochrome B [Betaproteobacteria bacterium HGW-Betaproteobacteria-7]